jgi:hypothetical protein
VLSINPRAAIMDTHLRLFDLICGPELPTRTDENQEQLLYAARPIATFDEKPFEIDTVYSSRSCTILFSTRSA